MPSVNIPPNQKRAIAPPAQVLAGMSADVLECEATQVAGVSYEQVPSGSNSSCRLIIVV